MEMMNQTPIDWKSSKNVRAMLVTFLVIISLYFVTKIITEVKNFDTPSPLQNIISIDGYGEVATIADTANISFSVNEEAKTVADAQKVATEKTNAILAYLKTEGIADKDVKTDSYNISPHYDYTAQPQVCGSNGCPPSKQVITGYEVSQSVTVKIREVAKAGDILVALGQKGASNVSNLSFTIDQAEQEQFQLQAKQAAIADAKSKAEVIAQSLGVRLVRITGMYDNSGGPVYGKAMGGDMMLSAQAAPAPQLPQGENKITSNVTVTYEIK